MEDTLKEKVHTLGVDDSPFSRKDRSCTLVGVLMSHDFHVDSIITREIDVDGNDASDALLDLLTSGSGRAADIVMTNGITFAGFNMYEPEFVYKKSGTPVISVTRNLPDLNAMIDALQKYHAPDYKIDILKRMEPVRIVLKTGSSVYANFYGLAQSEVANLVNRMLFRGNIPEPIRIAHLIGTVLKKGKTGGRA